MIFLDNRSGFGREGVNGFAARLRGLGLPVTLTRLAYGDIRFLGYGPEGLPVTIGVECKSVHDLLACMCDGRFAGHQAPGLVTEYQQPWLLMEGEWRAQKGTGLLEYFGRDFRWKLAEVGSRRFMWRDLESWLLTIETKVGLRAHWSLNWEAASVWIATLYSWWTNGKRVNREGEVVAGWESHRSHLAVNEASNEQFWGRVRKEELELERARRKAEGDYKRLQDSACLLRPTWLRLMIAQAPQVGYVRSAAFEKRFPSMAAVCEATEKELTEVEGVGKTGAKKIWKALHQNV